MTRATFHPNDALAIMTDMRADDTTQPVRMYGRKLFVTPTGTEDWHH